MLAHLKPEYFKDGQSYEEVNGKKVDITVKDGKNFCQWFLKSWLPSILQMDGFT